MDSGTLSKLEKALPNLEVVLWLRKWAISEYQPVIKEAGYSSLTALCTLTPREVDKVCFVGEPIDTLSAQNRRTHPRHAICMKPHLQFKFEET